MSNGNYFLDRGRNENILLYYCLSCEKSKLVDFFNDVQEEYFLDGERRNIFNACKKIFFRDGFIAEDLIKVETGNRHNNKISELYEDGYHEVKYKINHFINIAKNYYIRDGVYNAIKKFNFEDVTNVNSQADFLINEISQLATVNKKMEVVKMSELCKKTLNFVEEAYKNKNRKIIKSGINSLDEILYELEPAYYIIGARTSLGKSALSWSIATSLAAQDIGVLYFSLEMSPVSLAIRETAMKSGLKIRNIKSGFVDEKGISKIMGSIEKMSRLNLSITEGGDCDISSIVREIRRSHFVDGTKAFFIDHISLLKSRGLVKKTSFEKFEEISSVLQNIQRELDIYIFGVAQLGRGTEGKEPSLADIRGSGAFEQDADIVFMIHRQRVAAEGSTDIPTSILVQKNRNGQCGVAPVMFTPSKTLFRDMTFDEKKDWEAQQREAIKKY